MHLIHVPLLQKVKFRTAPRDLPLHSDDQLVMVVLKGLTFTDGPQATE
jgi:hypothetical protein